LSLRKSANELYDSVSDDGHGVHNAAGDTIKNQHPSKPRNAVPQVMVESITWSPSRSSLRTSSFCLGFCVRIEV